MTGSTDCKDYIFSHPLATLLMTRKFGLDDETIDLYLRLEYVGEHFPYPRDPFDDDGEAYEFEEYDLTE